MNKFMLSCVLVAARRASLLCVVVSFCLLAIAPVRAATVPAGFTDTVVANNLTSATAMAIAPDGRIFVCLQGGSLRVVKNGSLLATPFLTVTVDSSGERGLLGIAFDPNFNANQYIYVYYTATTPATHNRVSRFTANGDVAVAGSETVLLDLNNLSGATNHNGGAMHFGPDGKLYIAVGENANSANSQTLANLLGKMLRINAVPGNIIPTDNPFFSTATGNNRAIWALGLRNPYTFNFQSTTGRMFINDVGQNTYEEVNDGIAGSNYGWPTCEGQTCGSTPPAGYRAPLFIYAHSGAAPTGCAITGGVFYNPVTAQFPASYVGKYFFADFCTSFIRTIDPASPAVSTDFATGTSSPVDLQVSNDGSLYYLQRGGTNGELRRVQYPAGQTAPSISAHPQSQTIPVGQPVTFTVSASGSTPLGYQWQRNNVNIPGANSASYTISSVSTGDNGAQFRCVVSNAFGSATSNNATLTVTSNTAPTATINTPTAGTLYNAGDTINYSGSATDTQDGTLPASAFTWQVDFHHDTHTHPFVPATSGSTSGSFVIPTTGETAANVFYRIILTVTDSGGLTHQVFRDVTPRTATVTLRTNPAGLQVTLDGQPKTDGYVETNVVNIQRTLGVVSYVSVGGVTYNFVSWSDSGAATHNVNVPATNTTYTANFARASNAHDVLISEFRLDGPGGALDEFVELYNNTDADITVSTDDLSSGWSLVSGVPNTSGGTALQRYHLIPNGTIIPARGHYLGVGGGYSLQNYGGTNRAQGDAVAATTGLGLQGSNAVNDPFLGVGLFRSASTYTATTRLDSVGMGCTSTVLNEGAGLAYCTDAGTGAQASVNYSVMRKLLSGTPQDTDDNAADFNYISPVGSFPTAGGTTAQAILGAPGPENSNSPVQRNATIKAALVDSQVASSAPPNRVRNQAAVANGQFGTLTIRRKFTNKTGRTITALRFRLIGITTLGSPVEVSPQADLRLLTSTDENITTSGGATVTILGTSLEEPAAQSLGGGLNSSVIVPLAGGGLINNASLNVQFRLGVEQNGGFRFFVNVEGILAPPAPNSATKRIAGKNVERPASK